MSRTEDQVEQFLYNGESVREAFDIGPVRVVLTTHRVFTDNPDNEGLQQAEFLDVTGVERTRQGSRSGVAWAVSLAAVGIALLVAGLAVGQSDVFTTPEFQDDTAAEIGAGGFADLVGWLLWLVEHLDVLLAGGGLLVLLLAGLAGLYYWVRVREPALTITTTGERSDIHLPLEFVSVEDEFRLEQALVPEQVSDELDGVDTEQVG